MLKNYFKKLFLLLSLLSLHCAFGENRSTSKINFSLNDTLRIRKKNVPLKKLTNIAPVLTAAGNQLFCPGTPLKIVTDFNIVDPDDIGIDAIYIQISSGYVSGQDQLTLTGIHPTISSNWNQSTGKLTLTGVLGQPTYVALIAAVKNIDYSSSNANPSGVRNFSITVGQANYLPSNGHYYQYVPNIGVTWTSAKTLAQNSTYYGLQGYLATITSAGEAQLAGEQAAGAGWIGGSDQATEGIWIWLTGPENGTIFWNGGINGSTTNFAFWNSGEPNNAGNENYAHITAPEVGIPGSWNDLSNTGEASGNYQPKGFIIEYGGMPGDPTLQISASTVISIPAIQPVNQYSVCYSTNATLNASATNGTVKWYQNASGGTPLAVGNSFTTPNLTTTTSYYLDAYPIGCATGIRVPLTVTVIQIPVLTVTTTNAICGNSSITLTAATSAGIINWYSSNTDTTPLTTGTTFTTPVLSENTTYYVEANYNGCSSSTRTAVTVTVNPLPNVTDQVIIICEGYLVQLNAGIANMTYLWSTGETSQTITSTPGVTTYSVVVTSPENCSKTKNFTIIEHTIPVITNVLIEGTTATIITSGFGDFEYSVDGINYQSSNVFYDLQGGIHTAYVTETNFCGNDFKTFIIITIPPFFTPNNDGYNDFWYVKGMNYYPNSEVKIFDRYGKFIIQLDAQNTYWDGNLNGKSLFSTDYWYVMKLNETTPEQRGHFSLLR